MAVNRFMDAFISYGRIDSKAFAIQLYQHLTELGLQAWLDQSDIPLAVDFQNQIEDGIKSSDNFIFIISPHAVNSPYCHNEIELAIQYNKRIIPLLHVEEIDRKTWQQRNPEGTDADWKAFQASGLNSCFPNMHPEIAKINWVYLREGIDDYTQSFNGLDEIFERHRDYVQLHTTLLLKADEWRQHQQQSRYLLVGEERQQAEEWLTQRFPNGQPPCLPTDLHCEFIAESTKNAHNLMTQIFLAHADEDDAISDKFRRGLMRVGFTVWTSKVDIHIGTEFLEAIQHGIESADNILYLLSPESIHSKYCQHEVEYALSLNKRIIPVLVKAMDPEQLPLWLRRLQYIDLTDNVVEADYLQDENQLLRILQQDATYYEEHKVLLVKALKWQQQGQNPSLLLRGYNLRHAEAWLKAAKQRSQHAPTSLQETFIQESLKQPPEMSLDVFISYSRTDSDFARKLNDALQIQGKTTWFDQESIASGADFQQEIYRGIETSNHFLFIISPNSVNSPFCAGEVEYAKQLNKRIVTVLHRPIASEELHPVLANIQWIDFNKHNSNFYANFGELIRTLDTNQDYLRSHTRLLTRAIEWERTNRDSSYLLYGTDLATSEQWLQQAVSQEPNPTDLHFEYIAASQQLRQQRQATEVSYQQARQELKRALVYRRPKLRSVLLSSVGVAFLVLVVRFLGLLQPLELAAYDALMRLRPSEGKDDRFLVVEVTDADIQNELKERGTSLSDTSLSRLLEKLNQYQPRLIGLDVYRDYKASPELAKRLGSGDRLYTLCKVAETDAQGNVAASGTAPPENIPPNRVGFSDVVEDQDGAVRRHLLLQETVAGAQCSSEYAFSLLLAKRYLELNSSSNSSDQAPLPTPENLVGANLQLGNTPFNRFQPFTGGYQFADAFGYQILLNYRSYTDNVRGPFERVTLGQVLNNQVSPDLFKDKIVLIGVTSLESVKDYKPTPFGTGSRELPGVIIQAHMTSQILSAVLDGRPLLWVWPQWGEALWILGWSLVGGVLVWRLQQLPQLGLAVVISISGLVAICFVVFTQAGWIPLVPSALGLAGTSGILLSLSYRRPYQAQLKPQPEERAVNPMLK